MLAGTFVLRVSTSVTGTMLVFYIADLNKRGLERIGSGELAILDGGFYITELGGSLLLGIVADRFGRKAVMLLGPVFGAIAVFMTGLTTKLHLLFITRLLEGASTAASVPSTLGFIAAETDNDELLRGRAVAVFELVTLGGLLAVGPALGGLMYHFIGSPAFFVNCGFYIVALGLYAYGVTEMRTTPAEVATPAGVAATESAELAPAQPSSSPKPASDWRRFGRVLTDRRVLLFAPTWIAINAVLGLWRSQGPFLLTGGSPFKDPHQLLMKGFDPIQIGLGMAVLAVFFGAGILFWGNLFGRLRRTTIMLAALAAFAVGMVVVFVVNHAAGAPLPVFIVLVLVLCAALFIMAGATPAALGFLADVSEAFTDERSTIMGLYSVFLGLGQVIGIAAAGVAASIDGIDGLIGATVILTAIGLAAMLNLRADEHRLGAALDVKRGSLGRSACQDAAPPAATRVAPGTGGLRPPTMDAKEKP